MNELRSRDLSALAGFLLTLYASDSRDAFITTILTGLKALIPCSYTSYNEIDLHARHTFAKSHGNDQALYHTLQPAFLAYLDQHPWGRHVLMTPDSGVRSVSDFLPDRVFRKLALYQEYYRPLGVSRQLGVSLSVPPALFIPIAINRDGRDYGARERQMVDVLRPHLTLAFQNARVWARLSERHASLQRLVHRLGKVLVRTDRFGKILWASPGLDDLLRRHRLLSARPSSSLPAPILDWFVTAVRPADPHSMLVTPAMPLRLRTAGGVLTVHLLKADEEVRVLLEERSVRTSSQGGPASVLGLREWEVLRILATGQSNDQIAQRLGISPRTVHKHLEQIYEKLGVEHRTAAVGRLWELTAPET